MKFLKSQGIVLVLAAIAILLVGKNLVWPFLKPKFASRPTPAAATTSSAPAAKTDAKSSALQSVAQNLAGRVTEVLKSVQSQTAATPAARVEKMDRQAMLAQAANWVISPLRDPFKMRGGVNDRSARDQLKLTGILRQTDSELAVINGLIVSAGEMILGFQVELVEPDRVWVKGPNGRESLEFKYFVAGPEKVVTVEVQPASADASKPAQEESAAQISTASKPPQEELPQPAPAPLAGAVITAPAITPALPATASGGAIPPQAPALPAPLIVETEKDRQSRRQPVSITDDLTAGPPIDR